MSSSVLSPTTLPCGKVVPNRLVKVALYEHLADFRGGPPNKHHFALYKTWSTEPHGYGMVFTGNVQVSPTHLTLGRDMVIPTHISEATLEPYLKLCAAIHSNGKSLAIMQLSHTAPSSVRVGSDHKDASFFARLVYRLAFHEPKAMTTDDLSRVIEEFVRGAQVAHQSGFDGVQLHAAHGYLLAQFLNPKTNQRTDKYAVGDDGNELLLLRTIVERIRKVVPKDFAVGVKLNAGDYSSNADDTSLTTNEQRALNHITIIAGWGGVDFIEISGGDYESPDFMQSTLSSRRQAFFSRISRMSVETLEKMPRQDKSAPLPLILLTGGLNSPAKLQSALDHKHAHLLGIGRSSILVPNIPSTFAALKGDPLTHTEAFAPEPIVTLPKALPKIPIVGAGAAMCWYNLHLRMIARWVNGKTPPSGTRCPDYTLTGVKASILIWFWRTEPINLNTSFRFAALSLLAAVCVASWLVKGSGYLS